MSNCLNCGAEIKQSDGTKPKKYCDDNCKQKAFQKKKNQKLKMWDDNFPESEQRKMIECLLTGLPVISINSLDDGIKVLDFGTPEYWEQYDKFASQNPSNTIPDTKTKKPTPSTPKEEITVETPKNDDKLKELQDELDSLPKDGQLAKQRRKFLEQKIKELKC